MSIFKQTLLAATLCGVFGVAAAAPEGGSSQTDIDKKPTVVKPGESDSQPFGEGKAGLAFSTDNGHSWSNSINLEDRKFRLTATTPMPMWTARAIRNIFAWAM